MESCVCACGAKYRFPEESAGRIARCRKCGKSFMLQAGALAERTRSASAPVVPSNDAVVQAPIVETDGPTDESEILVHDAPSRGYWQSLFWSLLFPSGPSNLTIFLSIWLLFALVGLIPSPRVSVFRFLVLPMFLLGFWFAAFRVIVAEAAVAGAFRLPDLELTSDLLADLIGPALRWYVSWLLALAPAVAWAMYTAYSGINVAANTLAAIEIALTAGLPGPAADTPLIALVALGLFIWPMIACVVILGEFRNLWRVPLMLPGIIDTWAGYAMTVLIAALAAAVFILSIVLSPSPWMRAAGVAGAGAMIIQRALWTGAEVYFGILLARSLGLYFRHFGHRFAADWSYQEE